MFTNVLKIISRVFGIEHKEKQRCYWHLVTYSPAARRYFSKMKKGVAVLTVLPGHAWKFDAKDEAQEALKWVARQSHYEFFVERVEIP